MKHIKKYKIFESSSESMEDIIQYLEDIFQEVEDSGFTVKICRVFSNPLEVVIIISKIDSESDNQIEFELSDIIDYKLSAIDYMSSIGYRCSFDSTRFEECGQIFTFKIIFTKK